MSTAMSNVSLAYSFVNLLLAYFLYMFMIFMISFPSDSLYQNHYVLSPISAMRLPVKSFILWLMVSALYV